jgi:thiol:disulfide interchange protein DsbC
MRLKHHPTHHLKRYLTLAAILVLAGNAHAQDAAIRQALKQANPNLPAIDEIRKSPIPGLFEVRYGGTEIVYVDAQARHVIQGAIIDLRTKTDLTQERIDRLTALDFAALPLKDAIVVKQGNGARKIAVFADPNCGFCKRFERDLASLKDVTIYNFVIPILGEDSKVKSRNIWCAADPAKAWRDWMLEGAVPGNAQQACDDTALERNVAMARKHRVNGTPATFFEDGSRQPGAQPLAEIEKRLAALTKKP